MNVSRPEDREALKILLEDSRQLRAKHRWHRYRLAEIEKRLEACQLKEADPVEYQMQRKEIEALRHEIDDALRDIQHQRTRITSWLYAAETRK